MDNCIFCRIINKQITSNILFEDDKTIVIRDIHPITPVHLLIIPKEHVEDFIQVKYDSTYLAVANTIKQMIEKNQLMGKGYKIEVNGGGAQIIKHLHFHLMGPQKVHNG